MGKWKTETQGLKREKSGNFTEKSKVTLDKTARICYDKARKKERDFVL